MLELLAWTSAKNDDWNPLLILRQLTEITATRNVIAFVLKRQTTSRHPPTSAVNVGSNTFVLFLRRTYFNTVNKQQTWIQEQTTGDTEQALPDKNPSLKSAVRNSAIAIFWSKLTALSEKAKLV